MAAVISPAFSLGILLAQLIIQYGIPQALTIWQICQKDVITDADIAILRDIKPPSFYMSPPTQ